MALARVILTLAAVVIAITIIAGCGGSAAPATTTTPGSAVTRTTPASGPARTAAATATPTPPARNTGNAPMSAEVNGRAWSSSAIIQAAYRNNFFSLTGFDPSGVAITFGVGQATGASTYPLAYLNSTGSSAIVANSAGQAWNSFIQGGTGYITFTTLTPNRATGTFFFEAVPSVGGATGTMKVTNGWFDVTY